MLPGTRFFGGKSDYFFTIKSGKYFLEPATILTDSKIMVDGKPVTGETFYLNAGRHYLSYAGKPANFNFLWLPRNGERWRPVADQRSEFFL